VIVTAGAARGLDRCRRFLDAKDPEAARRAGAAIEQRFALLETAPDIGRPVPDMPELRELAIGFGASGYVALYRHEPAADTVHVLAFRHQKEAGY
jgi:plasmid stabilization system protein ParE